MLIEYPPGTCLQPSSGPTASPPASRALWMPMVWAATEKSTLVRATVPSLEASLPILCRGLRGVLLPLRCQPREGRSWVHPILLRQRHTPQFNLAPFGTLDLILPLNTQGASMDQFRNQAWEGREFQLTCLDEFLSFCGSHFSWPINENDSTDLREV